MTENERKLKEKMQKVKNLADRPGSVGEGQVAKSMFKKLQAQLKELQRKQKEKSTQEPQTYRLKFWSSLEINLFAMVCDNFGIRYWHGNRTKKGMTIKIRATELQAEILQEIFQIIYPAYETFQKKAYEPVRKAYREFSDKMREYEKGLFEGGFPEAEVIDPTVTETVNSTFEDEEDEEEYFDEWD